MLYKYMPKTIIKIRTWACHDCNYHQDFDVDDVALMALHFPGVEVGHCPACFQGLTENKQKKRTLMTRQTDETKKTTITIMGEEEVEELEVDDTSKTKDVEGKFQKRKLVKAEKDAYKQKIRDDVVKFNLMRCEL